MDENTTAIARSFDPPTNYAFSGKIMLISVVILFAFCLLIVYVHIYARRFLLRRRRRHNLLLRGRQFYINSDLTLNHPSVTPPGLDPSVLKSLPTFLYASKTRDPLLECAVCLSEFGENETGRVLPRCNHLFHVECIDLWFHSHSNCPLCRAPVQLMENPGRFTENPIETVVTLADPAVSEGEPSSGFFPTCGRDEYQMGCSSASSPPPAVERRKPPELVGVTVEVSGDKLGS